MEAQAFPSGVVAERLRRELEGRGQATTSASASAVTSVAPGAAPAVGEDAAVFLSAVLEHVTQSLLSHATQAGGESHQNQTHTADSTHLAGGESAHVPADAVTTKKLIHPRDIRSSVARYNATRREAGEVHSDASHSNDKAPAAASEPLFPPDVVQKRLDESLGGRKIGENASVYLSAVLQHQPQPCFARPPGSVSKIRIVRIRKSVPIRLLQSTSKPFWRTTQS